MTVYPHSLRRSLTNPDAWFYSDSLGNHLECLAHTATGAAGSVTAFHCMTLHGTGFNQSVNPRISLRYLIKINPTSGNEDCLHAKANQQVIGPMKMLQTRLDVTTSGYQRTGSSLHSHDDWQKVLSNSKR
jgi:ectoine hydroxylase-related dioxygenase (phytanoyl-CoA dioxygenase family)